MEGLDEKQRGRAGISDGRGGRGKGGFGFLVGEGAQAVNG
jgi:hypothetical protein